jgi:hypothetical protein
VEPARPVRGDELVLELASGLGLERAAEIGVPGVDELDRHVEVAHRPPDQFFSLEPGDALDGRVHVDVSELPVETCDEIRGGLQHRAELVFALLHAHPCFAPLGHVACVDQEATDVRVVDEVPDDRLQPSPFAVVAAEAAFERSRDPLSGRRAPRRRGERAWPHTARSHRRPGIR